MTAHEWRNALTLAVHHRDRTQLDAIVDRLAASERAASILHAHGHYSSGQPLDVLVGRALNVKALHD